MKCVDAGIYKLAEGKTYDVEPSTYGERDKFYSVVDDTGVRKNVFKWRFEPIEDNPQTPRETQVGGNHYAKLAIQPYDYVTANGIGMVEGNVIKYVTRWKDKGGVEDLKKALHSLQWLIDYTEKQS